MGTEHEFSFDVQISSAAYTTVTEEEYKDFSREDESIEEYAERKTRDSISKDLTMRIADDGIPESNIEIEGVNEHTKFDF